MSGKNVQWHLGNAYVEPTLGLLLLGALLAFLAWHETQHRAYLAIVAALCGAAAASKYTGWYFGGAILAGVLIASGRSAAPLRARVRLALMPIGVSSLLVLPWLVKNAVVTGNPIYPNLYGWLGGGSWSAIQSFHYLRSQSYAGGPRGYLESLPAIPWHLTIADNFFYAPSFSIALMALFLAALAMPASWRPPARSVTASAVIGLACWAFTARQGRFLVAWVPVMTLVAAQALAFLKGRALPQAAVLVLVLAAGTWQLRTQRYAYEPPVSLLVGDRQARVPRNLNYEVCRALNEEVPDDGRVLGLWENRFFFLERAWDGDSAYEAPTGLAALRAAGDAGVFAAGLRARNVTHVVVNTRVMGTYFANTLGFDLLDAERYPAARLEADRALMHEFLTGHLEERHRIGAVTIYRLRHGGT